MGSSWPFCSFHSPSAGEEKEPPLLRSSYMPSEWRAGCSDVIYIPTNSKRWLLLPLAHPSPKGSNQVFQITQETPHLHFHCQLRLFALTSIGEAQLLGNINFGLQQPQFRCQNLKLNTNNACLNLLAYTQVVQCTNHITPCKSPHIILRGGILLEQRC